MLDQTQLSKLTPDQKAAYQRYEQTFDTGGWSDVEKWAEAQALAQLERMLNAPNWDVYVLARGARAAFTALVQLRETTELEYAAFAEQNANSVMTLDEIEHE